MQGREGERSSSTRGKGPSTADGAKVAAIFFFWVILIFSQLTSFSSARLLNKSGRLYPSSPQPRKARFEEMETTSFHAPSSPVAHQTSKDIDGCDQDSSTLYGDDKRIVHTGPNPLHN